MKTIDYKFSELCDEIDFWQDEALRYKKLYENSIKSHANTVNESIESSYNTIGLVFNALLDPESAINKGPVE